MIFKLLIGAAIIFVLFSMIRKYQKAPPAERRSWLIKIVLSVVVIAVIIGAMTGRVPIIAGIVAAGATLAKFGLRWGLPLAKMWFAKSGGNARFKSQYLHITVNFASGQVAGEVIEGEFKGQSLANLSDETLSQLLTEFQQKDKKSYYLLAAYMRSRGFHQYQQNQQQDAHTAHVADGKISVDEALEILNLAPMPTKKEVISAHRKLMSKLHPDKGGSDYLAARVNEAREVLLKAIDANT